MNFFESLKPRDLKNIQVERIDHLKEDQIFVDARFPQSLVILAYLVTGFLFFITLILLFHSPTKVWVQSLFHNNERTVLSVLSADFHGKGEELTVMKVAEPQAIVIELYTKEFERLELLHRLRLNESRQAYFKHGGKLKDLFVQDLTQDGYLEIIVPVADQNLLAGFEVLAVNPLNYQLETAYLSEVAVP